MANSDIIAGSRPVKKIYPATKYETAASQTIKKGDWVVKNSAGQIAIYTSGGALLGVAATSVENSSVGDEIFVQDHPDQIFENQVAGSGALADIFVTSTLANCFDAEVAAGTGKHEIKDSTSVNDLFQMLELGRDLTTGNVSEVGANTRFYYMITRSAHQNTA